MASNTETDTSQNQSDSSKNQSQPPRNKSNPKILIGIVVIVIVVLALIFLSMSGALSAHNYKATIYVHVTSTHIANVVDIDLYANGNLFKSDSLGALSSKIYEYDAWLSGTSGSITISGTSHGGGLGDASDSSTIDIADGETYNVYLTL
jgi:uncharacterized membrane protein YgcG